MPALYSLCVLILRNTFPIRFNDIGGRGIFQTFRYHVVDISENSKINYEVDNKTNSLHLRLVKHNLSTMHFLFITLLSKYQKCDLLTLNMYILWAITGFTIPRDLQRFWNKEKIFTFILHLRIKLKCCKVS